MSARNHTCQRTVAGNANDPRSCDSLPPSIGGHGFDRFRRVRHLLPYNALDSAARPSSRIKGYVESSLHEGAGISVRGCVSTANPR
jgi:hypothetical protein